MPDLARITLKTPIGSRTTLAVVRESNFGDFVEMERRGWIEDGEVKSSCQLQANGFLIWQLCDGITPDDVEKLGRRDFGAAVAMIRPFAGVDDSGTPA